MEIKKHTVLAYSPLLLLAAAMSPVIHSSTHADYVEKPVIVSNLNNIKNNTEKETTLSFNNKTQDKLEAVEVKKVEAKVEAKVEVKASAPTDSESKNSTNDNDKASESVPVQTNSAVSSQSNETQVQVNSNTSTYTPVSQLVKGTPAVQPTSSVKANSSVKQSAINKALSLQGIPYVWGGTSTSGFDCSGFVQYIYSQLGVNLPRVTQDQARATASIPVSQAEPGDLLFWGSAGAEYHVGIYLGNNQFIDADMPGDVTGVRNIYPSWMPSHAGRI